MLRSYEASYKTRLQNPQKIPLKRVPLLTELQHSTSFSKIFCFHIRPPALAAFSTDLNKKVSNTKGKFSPSQSIRRNHAERSEQKQLLPSFPVLERKLSASARVKRRANCCTESNNVKNYAFSQIPITLQKEITSDHEGKEVARCGFKIGGRYCFVVTIFR